MFPFSSFHTPSPKILWAMTFKYVLIIFNECGAHMTHNAGGDRCPFTELVRYNKAP